MSRKDGQYKYPGSANFSSPRFRATLKPPVFSGVRVTRSLVLCVLYVL